MLGSRTSTHSVARQDNTNAIFGQPIAHVHSSSASFRQDTNRVHIAQQPTAHSSSTSSRWRGTINPYEIKTQAIVAVNPNCTIEKGIHQDLAVIVKRSVNKILIEREIAFLDRARHEFVVVFRGWYEETDTGVMGLVMQKCDMDLKYWSDRAAKSPTPDLEIKKLQISDGIAKGLAYINNLNIIHNDLKPHNVFVDKFNKPYIGDFGVASNRGEGLLGYTKQYFDKESLGLLPDEKSDSWLLGATLWEFWSDEAFNVEEENLVGVVKTLLDFGADAHKRDPSGKIPLQLSTSVDVWRVLATKMPPHRGDLFTAALRNDDVSARLMLAAHENPVDSLSKAKAMNLDGWNGTFFPLHVAAIYGHVAVCEAFVVAGAEMDSKDSLGYTPLMRAAWHGHLGVVHLLVENGAQVDGRNNTTPLINAAWKGHLEVVRYLVEKGADINRRNHEQNTALILAANWGHLSVVRYLVERGADLGAKGSSGKTAREWALKQKRAAIAEFLTAEEQRGSGFNRR
ncbi:Serine/threonine-protein kinase/endoribonuclease IRE1 [Phlyctochytrium bullatum]|nr:Serine/threonine-protein kinase/endoribonuclease IRE1 [Phlyctochytrium bullatum]